VKVLNAEQNLCEIETGNVLWEFAILLQVVKKFSSRTEIQHQMQVVTLIR